MDKLKEKLYCLFIKQTDNTKIQFFRYIFVGGFSAVINIGTLHIFTEYIKLYYLLSNIVGFIFGLTTNYLLSRFLIFSKEKTNKKVMEFVLYAIIGLLGLGMDTLIMWIGTSLLGVYYMLSKIISTGIVFVWNFSIRKILYIFINKKGGKNNE